MLPPTSRTKAEAMERPEPGDRWRKGESLLTVEIARGASFSFSFNGYVRDSPGKIAWHENWVPLFRRWCAGAEYLGGADGS